MVRNENTGKQAKGQKYVKKKTKQKKKMAIMQPKDSYYQQQWYHNEVDHGQTGCS